MSVPVLPVQLAGFNVYMVGIKGTGMAALAEVLVSRGARVTGADVAETFYTDEMLARARIAYHEGFDRSHLVDATPTPNLVIYSAAYDPDRHPELIEARRMGIPIAAYTDALGALSRRAPSVGIAGVHGKTTTTAIVACIVQELGLTGTVLVGSALPDLDGRATLVAGDEFFVAETCEYRRHFLSFSPRAAVITSVEPDHLDYFRDAADIESAFVEFAHRLEPGGTLIYCADDCGASRVAATVQDGRPDLSLVPYGCTASGAGAVAVTARRCGSTEFTVDGTPYELHVPGDHNTLNAAAALQVVRAVVAWGADERAGEQISAAAGRAFAGFRGTRRRSEVVGEADGVLVIDDYGHHPTAIATTITGLRAFYPGRRIVLSFMPHTYSRTLALLDDFARALSAVDVLVLHDIYASAREENPGGVTGEVLAVAAREHHSRVHYVAGVLDAGALIERTLQPGDLFLTMGAGNNWQLGPWVLERLARVRR